MPVHSLALTLAGGRQLVLKGTREGLTVLRDNVLALMDRFATEFVTYSNEGQIEVIPVPEVEAVGRVQPV